MTDIERVETAMGKMGDTVTLQGKEMAALTATIKADMKHRNALCAEHSKLLFGNGKVGMNQRVSTLEDSHEKSTKIMFVLVSGVLLAIVGAVSSWVKHLIGVKP